MESLEYFVKLTLSIQIVCVFEFIVCFAYALLYYYNILCQYAIRCAAIEEKLPSLEGIEQAIGKSVRFISHLWVAYVRYYDFLEFLDQLQFFLCIYRGTIIGGSLWNSAIYTRV